MKCPRVWRFFWWSTTGSYPGKWWILVFLYAFLNHGVLWCVLSFVGEIIHWQCEIASGRSCGLQEVGVAPWAVRLWVPASTSVLILLFRLTCGWTNPSNQQHISTCDYFRLYSKTFNPSCACKSQDSSLFLWLGLSMKMEVVQHVLAVPQSDL